MATYEEAMTALRNADAAGDTVAAQRLAQIASGLKPAAAGPQEPGFLDKARGAVDAAGSAITSAVGGAVGTIGGTLGSVAGQISQGELGTPKGTALAQDVTRDAAAKLTTAPRTAAGQDISAAAGKAFDATKLQGVGPTEALTMGATPARAAAAQTGKALAPEMGAVKAIPGKIADAVTPKPAPEIAKLAKKAQDLGIELRPDMLSDNRIARSIGEALEQVPASGNKKDQRQIAFNGALTRIIGGDTRAKRLTPDVFDSAMSASGKKIGDISAQTPIAVDDALRQKFSTIVQEANSYQTADVAKIVNSYVDELVSKVGPLSPGLGGRPTHIQGETFRRINSKIGRQIRSTNNGDLKNALHDMQEVMHDALEANISSPERLAELKEARFNYAMGKIIEPLVAKAKGGDISPAGLMSAVTSTGAKKTMMARGRGGEIGDLAKIGQAFLKEPGSSGTAERNLAYGLLGDAAAVLRDAAIYPVANAYNRLGPKLTKRAIDMRAVDPQAQQPWNIGQP